MTNDTKGIIYIASNPEMSSLVKVGMTSKDDYKEKIKKLETGIWFKINLNSSKFLIVV